MNSLDLLVENDDYGELLKKTEIFFNLELNRVSEEYADGFNDCKKYIITASPTKIKFMTPNDFSILLNDVKEFLKNNFADHYVGLRSIGNENLLRSTIFDNVKSLIIT